MFSSSVDTYYVKCFDVGECKESSAGIWWFGDLIYVDVFGEVTVIFEASGSCT